jgi:glyoxylase-like metal-dependent hydrolase (beta-lactamase superfamily II)
MSVMICLFLATVGVSGAGAQTVDQRQYSNRDVLPDPSARPCPDQARTLTQIEGNLYRHTAGNGLAVHSGFVLITRDGALVIDPAMTCTALWLKSEITTRFQVPIKYVIYTHAHFDHIAGGQVFQQDGALVIAQRNALEPIVGERLPTAVPNQLFDRDTMLVLAGDTVLLHYVGPSHSNSMTMVSFPRYHALQCTDVCEHASMPYNDFLDFYYDGWIETLDWVILQDPKIIDVGHYTPATTADQRALRTYMVGLHQQVLDLVRQGQTWDELYRHVTFQAPTTGWIGFDSMRILNILGMHRWVVPHRRGVW